MVLLLRNRWCSLPLLKDIILLMPRRDMPNPPDIMLPPLFPFPFPRRHISPLQRLLQKFDLDNAYNAAAVVPTPGCSRDTAGYCHAFAHNIIEGAYNRTRPHAKQLSSVLYRPDSRL
uniref:Uncharacterized protein n=2 Tax=Picea TaxID=3328 RepID=A0A101LZ85_PICGL|nr:hypothetical protein ABT39_MTgene5068 [Picea glauca]QHR89744.1 hypothetical protein Q903MT_gene3766 [Picea sitchensis]